jgi:hypothetical protein
MINLKKNQNSREKKIGRDNHAQVVIHYFELFLLSSL